MHDGETAKIYQKDDCSITDEVGNDFFVSMRLIEGITIPIMPLTQFMTESWRMKSSYSGNQLFACMFKDGTRLYFFKKRNKLHYLRGKIIDEMVINNHVTQEP